MVDKLEEETVSLTSKLSETEKSLSELETLFKSSEELCENLKIEKAELQKVRIYQPICFNWLEVFV